MLLSAAIVAVTPMIGAQEAASASGAGWVPSSAGSEDAIVVGPLLFSPAFQLSWQDRDNIFFSDDDPVHDQVLQASARFILRLPVRQSELEFSYMPRYTDYRTYELQDKWSHHLDVGGRFVFAGGLVLRASYSYILGNLETREVDPGGELYFGDPRFTKHAARFGLEYWLSYRDGLFIDGEWTDLEHSDPRFFYDYTRRTLGVGWIHQLRSSLTLDLRYGLSDFDAHDGPLSSNSFRDSRWQDVTLGLDGQLSEVVGTGLRVGYRTIAYDLQPGDPPVSDFSGMVAEGYFAWELAHGSELRLDVLRSPYPSNFADNANYVATGAGLLYSIDRGTLYGQLSGRVQNNDYELPDPLTGASRSDDILTLGVGLGYRLNRRFSLWSSYLHEDRDSISRYSYDASIFTVGLRLGY